MVLRTFDLTPIKINPMKTVTEKAIITVGVIVNAPVEKVWTFWTDPRHIIHWNNASDDWFTPWAENDVRVGGRFISRMEARDGSQGFGFSGVYSVVVLNKQIFYILDDGREVRINFALNGDATTVTETFEAEQLNSIELQQEGWQAILDNFKKYVEEYGKFEMLHFELDIDAPVEKVYRTMIDGKGFADWTSESNPSSHFRGSWEKGSKILFLGMDQDGKMGGMVSSIRENIPYRFISIEHRGVVEDGKEIMNGPEVDEWAGGLENYSLREAKGKTWLSVDVDTNQKFKSYFEATWPKALNKLKAICEAK
jgi:uncharacterized protein YndB with AHSA1/START domain